MKNLWIIFGCLCLPFTAAATHNRAGEISYMQISELTYLITITTYTVQESLQADRCELPIKYGDGQMDTIPRVNGNLESDNCWSGELVAENIKMNIYQVQHTYPGPGSYTISMIDPNRNDGIRNFPNSVNTPFYIESELIISSFVGANNSPILLNPPVDGACVFETYAHNPGAVDVDGDSLTYSLVDCMSDVNQTIPEFVMPDEVAGLPNDPDHYLVIDPYFGTLIWETPQLTGEYNMCIRIDEYRSGVRIGRVLRDMQVTVFDCDNQPPEIDTLMEICVLAGDTVQQQIVATDPNNGTSITLTATGHPLIKKENPATFNAAQGVNVVVSELEWATTCNEVRKEPYHFTFKAEDDRFNRSGGVDPNLVDFQVLSVKIIAPPPINPTATPSGNTIGLTWEPAGCTTQTGYKIYRKIDSLGIAIDSCQTGIDPDSGYELIATVNNRNATTYTDTDDLVHGQLYCYRVVAVFPDGGESLASEEFCAELKKDVPVITHASVGITAPINGVDTVRWSKPQELDTVVQFQGPFHYEVLYNDGTGYQSVHVQSPLPTLSELDTSFVLAGINTISVGGTFIVNLYNNGVLIGGTQEGPTIFLTTTPSDEQLTLNWEDNTPWLNSSYVIYRHNKVTLDFEVLDTVGVPMYIDSVGLSNGRKYKYVVETIGDYSTSGFISPIINWSQQVVGMPEDNIAPCPPVVQVNSDCEGLTNLVSWTNPNEDCSDDVVGYRVYFSPFQDTITPFTLVAELGSDEDLRYDDLDMKSVAGCYYVTAIDTFFNESVKDTTVCVDNCPLYELPNVMSPGNDGSNDLFYPTKNRAVQRINLTIYNRWGEVVHKTNDPAINWDGRQYKTNKQVPTGVYYYVCEVFEIRLTGLEERTLTGFIHLFGLRDGTANPNN